jgi:hypothetical protein
MHIRDERVYKFCDAIYPLIRQADVYVGEMDLTDLPQRAATQGYNMPAFFRPAAYGKLRKQILKSQNGYPGPFASADDHECYISKHTGQ